LTNNNNQEAHAQFCDVTDWAKINN